MAWTIDYTETAIRGLRKMDKQEAKRILSYLGKIATLENPRSKGKGLTSNFSGYWRYRVGDQRVICDIRESSFVIVAIRIDHRSDVYN